MFGFTKDGYLHKRFADIVDEMQIEWEGLGYAWKVNGGFAVIMTIAAFAISKVWENLQVLYGCFVEDNAKGIQLDNSFSQVDLYRIPAARSTVTVTIEATQGTSIPAGTQVIVDGTGEIFESFGFETPVVGASGVVDVSFRSLNYGPIEAQTGTINELASSISGVTSVSNSADAYLGRIEERDHEFRNRKKRGAFNRGQSTTAALESDLRGLDGVIDVAVFQNIERVDDPVTGRIANSVEAVVVGGVQSEIVEKIYRHVDGGIRTDTTAEASEQVIDSFTDSGRIFPIKFSRGVEVNIYIQMTIVSEVKISEVEKSLIRDYIVELGQTQKLGDSVRKYFIESAVNKDTIFDEDNVTKRILSMGKETTPGTYAIGTGDISLSANEIAVLDSSRINIIAVAS